MSGRKRVATFDLGSFSDEVVIHQNMGDEWFLTVDIRGTELETYNLKKDQVVDFVNGLLNALNAGFKIEKQVVYKAVANG